MWKTYNYKGESVTFYTEEDVKSLYNYQEILKHVIKEIKGSKKLSKIGILSGVLVIFTIGYVIGNVYK